MLKEMARTVSKICKKKQNKKHKIQVTGVSWKDNRMKWNKVNLKDNFSHNYLSMFRIKIWKKLKLIFNWIVEFQVIFIIFLPSYIS